MKLPVFLKQGEAARLFPILADNSKEGRATSILLSCMAKVDEFALSQIKTLGIRTGKRTKLECFTEVVFADSAYKNKRPDGLLVVNTGAQKKYYLVEAKIGNAVLNGDQIESYVKICKEQKLDGVITISNQYSASPEIHPLEAVRKIKIKIPVYHWSWMSLLTTVDLMVANEDIEDQDQMLLMNELRRFLSHESTGVRSFDRMPKEWADINKIFSNKGSISAKSDVAVRVVEAWQQEAKDLCLVLSRLTNTIVSEKLQVRHLKDPTTRTKADIKTLLDEHKLESQFDSTKEWRTFANEQLKAYQSWFAYINHLWMLQAPSFASIFAWRKQQEELLAANAPEQNFMNDEQLAYFIQHYQRLTEHSLLYTPQYAQEIYLLDDNRQIISHESKS